MTAAYGCPPVREPDGCSPNPVSVTNRDAKTREIKNSNFERCFIPSFSLGEIDGSQPEAGQCKSIPVDPVVMGS